jgi:hypothetical protein
MRIVVPFIAVLALSASLDQAIAGRACYREVIIPAQYQIVAETVMVKPEHEVSRLAPAVLRQVEETVVISPARTIVHSVPAQYGVVGEDVLVSPARRVWQVGYHDGERVGCWVDVPATFEHRERRVIVTPAQAFEEHVPAEMATRLRTVVVEPEHVVTETIPAQYARRAHAELVSPATRRWAPAPDLCPGLAAE